LFSYFKDSEVAELQTVAFGKFRDYLIEELLPAIRSTKSFFVIVGITLPSNQIALAATLYARDCGEANGLLVRTSGLIAKWRFAFLPERTAIRTARLEVRQ
jgi:hypothetical protein